MRGLHGFFATKASAFAKATCGTSYGGTGSDTKKIELLTTDTLGTSFTDYGVFINRGYLGHKLRGLHGFFATKASAFAKATCGTSYGGTGSDTMKIRRRLTQIDADLFLPALASLSESLFDASIYRSFVLGRRVPSKPDPIFEAGENGVLLAAD